MLMPICSSPSALSLSSPGTQRTSATLPPWWFEITRPLRAKQVEAGLSDNLFVILAPNQGERASRVGKLFCAAVPKMYLCPLAVVFQYRAPTIYGVANVLPGFQFHCATSLLTHDQDSSYTRNCQSQASTGFGLFSYSSSSYNKDLSHRPSEGIRSRRYRIRMLFSWPAR
jgi:hypothetical protein